MRFSEYTPELLPQKETGSCRYTGTDMIYHARKGVCRKSYAKQGGTAVFPSLSGSVRTGTFFEEPVQNMQNKTDHF